MVLDATLLNTQHCKVRIKGKVDQSWEWSTHFCVVAIEKALIKKLYCEWRPMKLSFSWKLLYSQRTFYSNFLKIPIMCHFFAGLWLNTYMQIEFLPIYIYIYIYIETVS